MASFPTISDHRDSVASSLESLDESHDEVTTELLDDRDDPGCSSPATLSASIFERRAHVAQKNARTQLHVLKARDSRERKTRDRTRGASIVFLSYSCFSFSVSYGHTESSQSHISINLTISRTISSHTLIRQQTAG